jgi:hypothetical protein
MKATVSTTPKDSLREPIPNLEEHHGKLSAGQRETKRRRLAIFQVEAVMKMLSPEMTLRPIAPKRRNAGNPMVEARHALPGRHRHAADGHRADGVRR